MTSSTPSYCSNFTKVFKLIICWCYAAWFFFFLKKKKKNCIIKTIESLRKTLTPKASRYNNYALHIVPSVPHTPVFQIPPPYPMICFVQIGISFAKIRCRKIFDPKGERKPLMPKPNLYHPASHAN